MKGISQNEEMANPISPAIIIFIFSLNVFVRNKPKVIIPAMMYSLGWLKRSIPEKIPKRRINFRSNSFFLYVKISAIIKIKKLQANISGDRPISLNQTIVIGHT
ncbi:hypothetical protein CL616_00495 [archaeon]|nr:hypothetical protein [archaeon]